MVLSPGEPLLREYWRQFGAESEYRVYMSELKLFSPLVTTRKGDRVVGAIRRAENNDGALVLLPWLDFDREDFYVAEEVAEEEDDTGYAWTSAAMEWGRRYFETLKSLDDALKFRDNRTPTPQWAQSDTCKTSQELTLSEALGENSGPDCGPSSPRGPKRNAKIARAASLTSLLFEQGHELEGAVLQAMSLMGFEANSYRDADSEFDAVLECPRGTMHRRGGGSRQQSDRHRQDETARS